MVSDVKLAQRRAKGQGRAEERVGEFLGHYIGDGYLTNFPSHFAWRKKDERNQIAKD